MIYFSVFVPESLTCTGTWRTPGLDTVLSTGFSPVLERGERRYWTLCYLLVSHLYWNVENAGIGHCVVYWFLTCTGTWRTPVLDTVLSTGFSPVLERGERWDRTLCQHADTVHDLRVVLEDAVPVDRRPFRAFHSVDNVHHDRVVVTDL